MNANVEVMEHRWGTRVTLELPAQLQAAGGALLHVSLANASLSGAYVRTGMPLPVLSKVWVRTRGGNAWLEACVVRQDSAGMGIEWIEPGIAAVVELLTTRATRGVADIRPPESWQLPQVRQLPAASSAP